MDNLRTNLRTNGIFKNPKMCNPLVLLGWQGSSVGESAGFITPRSAVQICLLLPVIVGTCGDLDFLKLRLYAINCAEI